MAKANIAIDGPSGVGKSTIADVIADKLHYIHLDTGAMYRATALAIQQAQIDPFQDDQLKQVLNQLQIEFDHQNVLLNGQDVSKKIRTNDISQLTSQIATLPLVRQRLVDLQKQIASQGGYILDGRDIGTVVLPDAQLKIYMDASAKARANRRYHQYVEAGVEADYEVIYQDIVARDYQDMHRELSPLKQAEDAIYVDTSLLTVDEVVERILDIIKQAL